MVVVMDSLVSGFPILTGALPGAQRVHTTVSTLGITVVEVILCVSTRPYGRGTPEGTLHFGDQAAVLLVLMALVGVFHPRSTCRHAPRGTAAFNATGARPPPRGSVGAVARF